MPTTDLAVKNIAFIHSQQVFRDRLLRGDGLFCETPNYQQFTMYLINYFCQQVIV